MQPNVEKKVDQFFAAYGKKTYKNGEHLILAEGDPTHVFQLIKGQVRQYDITATGEEVVVNVFKPPAFFPMAYAIAGIKNKYFFEAVGEIHVRTAPVAAAAEFVKINPDVMLDLLQRLYRGSDGLLRRMAHLMGGSAKSRLIFELIIECRRFSKQRKDDSYLLVANESEIGARSGLSRETVSREIKELKKSGLVKVDRSGIVVNDLPALEQKLGPNL